MSGPGAVLRVATFNIRNGRAFDGLNCWPLRRYVTARMIRSLEADVLGLQEAFRFQLRWLRRRSPGFAAHGQGRDGARRGEFCPILSRSARVRVVGDSTRWYAEGDAGGLHRARLPGASFRRIATTVVLDEGGRRFQVLNTHLDERSDSNRMRSATQLLGWLAPDLPTVVTGDFNAPPDDPLFGILAAAGLRQALPADAGGTNHDFTGRLDGRRIDHLLVSPHWEIVASGISTYRWGPFLPSDHWPVWADLRLADPEG